MCTALVLEMEVNGETQNNRTQLNNVANSTHDEETNTNSLAESQELLLVGCRESC